MRVWAVRDDEETYALFSTSEVAEQYRQRLTTAEAAGWADSEQPGWSDSVEVVPVTVFETGQIPDDYVPEWM